MKNKLLFILSVVVVLIFLICYFFVFNNKKNNTQRTPKSPESPLELPYIKMPIEYFSEKNIRWGSVDTNNNNKWKEASLNEMTYQSYPTTIITLDPESFENETRELGRPKTLEEVLKENEICGENKNESCGFESSIIENYKQEKYLAGFYLPVDFVFKEEFDVDTDGEKEIIAFLCGVGGTNCSHGVEIIKDNKVIFSAYSTEIDLKETENKNGFYLEWHDENKDFSQGYCCPTGYVRTRFIFKDKKFVPILEQKVEYLKIKEK